VAGQFGWGNLASIETAPTAAGVDVRAKLIEFYERYYVSHAIKVVVESAHSLDEMQNYIADSFARIPCAPTHTHEKCVSRSRFKCTDKVVGSGE
jgi:secreted Zn-dependent insulinase-like peptidase